MTGEALISILLQFARGFIGFSHFSYYKPKRFGYFWLQDRAIQVRQRINALCYATGMRAVIAATESTAGVRSAFPSCSSW